MGVAGVMAGMGSVFGEVVAMGALFPITSKMTPKWSFATASIVTAVMIIPLFFAIKEPKLRNDDSAQQ